jgi:proteasome accessory factor A
MNEIELRPRIVGLENEYPVSSLAPGDGSADLIQYDRISIMQDAMYQGMLALPISGSTNLYLENGARYYIDINEIPEYATPECKTFVEAVAYDIHGETHVAENISALVREGVFTKAQLNKRVVDHSPSPVTLGAHENYHIDIEDLQGEEPASVDFMEALGVHLATRGLYCGAGSVDSTGKFHKTQKLRTLEVAIGGSTTNNKSVVNTRLEHLAGPGNHRVHVTSGDSNISPWAAWMKMGTTSLVLRLLEFDLFPDDVRLKDIAASAQAYGSGQKIHTKTPTKEGKKMSALDIQRRILERVQLLASRVKLPDEELLIIDEWTSVLDDLAHDVDTCDDRIDWLVRKRIVDLVGGDTYPRKRRDLNYDVLYPTEGYGVKLRDKGGFREVPGLDAVDTLAPPFGTRAFVRGIGIRALALARVDGARAEWTNLDIPKIGRFALGSPYDSTPDALKRWLWQAGYTYE